MLEQLITSRQVIQIADQTYFIQVPEDAQLLWFFKFFVFERKNTILRCAFHSVLSGESQVFSWIPKDNMDKCIF